MYGSTATVGYANGAVTERPVSPLETTGNAVREAIGRVHALIGTVNMVADNVFGSPPPTPGGLDKNVDTPPRGYVDNLSRLTSELHQSLNALEVQVERIRNL